MSGDDTYELYIDAFTPASIPMARLAEYMRDFAALLGNEAHVHFEKLRAGSTVVISRVDTVAQNKVRRRLEEVRYGTAPKAAMDAFGDIDDKLSADNALGRILHRGARIIEFPGASRPVEPCAGPILQPGTLDGEVIQVGGRDETINVHIRSGDEIQRCITTKAVARRLAHHIFGPPVRVRGTGTWSRAESGAWKLHRFDIESFETLDETPLSRLFDGLRARLGPPEGGRMNPAELVRHLREE
ncbi:MAG: hypothetical protein FJW34_21365 [Acidobacteria bacterium]|nr:hypothetical protein [Acidobacteriota bacterium]